MVCLNSWTPVNHNQPFIADVCFYYYTEHVQSVNYVSTISQLLYNLFWYINRFVIQKNRAIWFVQKTSNYYPRQADPLLMASHQLVHIKGWRRYNF